MNINWFHDLSIHKKLLFLAGFGTLATLLVIAMAVYTHQQTVKQYESLFEKNTRRLILSQEIGADLVAARSSVKTFQLNKGLYHAEVALQQIAEAIWNAEQLLGVISPSPGDMSGSGPGTETIELLKKYQTAINGVFSAWKRKGLDVNSGLQGKFRKTAKELEQHIQNLNMSDLYQILLQLRRNEKDFVVRRQEKYSDQFDTNLVNFHDKLDVSVFDPKLKSEISTALNAYKGAVQTYREIRRNAVLDINLPEYKSQSQKAHVLEKIFQANHVTDMESHYLKIRSHERDYLLQLSDKFLTRSEDAVQLTRDVIWDSQLSDEKKLELEELFNSYQSSFFLLVWETKEVIRLEKAMQEVADIIEPILKHDIA